MCAGVLSQARISHVVYGASDPSHGALGGAIALHTQVPDWQPEVCGRILQEDCAALLQSFFGEARRKTGPKRLLRDFYTRPADTVAKEMLGKLLCVRPVAGGDVLRYRITETEAYFGQTDSASHAYKGVTDRNRPMFDKGGTVYVYLCYGLHNMFNIATEKKGIGQAVLIRGIEGAPGPGKLTKLLGIDRRMNGADTVQSDRVWLEDDGAAPEYTAAPRIGIDYALPKDREALWRFTVAE